MAALPERRTSSLARWARSVSAFSLVLFITAGLGHRYGLVEPVGFFWLLGLIALLALAGLLLAVGGFMRLWQHGDRAGRASLVATAISALVLSPFAAGAYCVIRYPALTQISTDLVDPPRFVMAVGKRGPGENPISPISPEAARLQGQAYPDLSGRRYEASLERILPAVRAVIAMRGWRPYSSADPDPDASEFAVEVDAPTFLFRFPGDAVVRLIDEGNSTFVDSRINSRYGRHDFGDGARRIGAVLDDLDREFARQSMEIIDIPPSTEDEDAVE